MTEREKDEIAGVVTGTILILAACYKSAAMNEHQQRTNIGTAAIEIEAMARMRPVSQIAIDTN